MGKLLFAFTVFWAYIAFSQYFLIWYANITEETRFYLIRNTEGWRWVSIFIVVGHFVGPFILLLSQPRKKNPVVMVTVCLVDHLHAPRGHVLERDPRAWPVAWHGCYCSWSIWGDIFALMGVVGTMGFIFLRKLGGNSLYPWRDPRLLESVNVVN
jgi:hypothetical protein